MKAGSRTEFAGSVRCLLLGVLVVGTVAVTVMVTGVLDVVLAAPPVGGDPISIQGPTPISSPSAGVIRAVVAADLDANGHPDIAFGQAEQLRVQAHVGTTTTQWAQTVTVGSATYSIRDVHAVDLDRDGAVDLVSASADDAGNSQLRLWQNPGSPFTDSWTISNTLVSSAMSLTCVASADLDRNGTPDLASGGLDGVLRLWSNPLTGTQAFGTSWPSPATISTPGDQIRQVILADVDRDGWTDIVEAAGDGSSGTVRLWRNPGDPFANTWAVSNTLGTLTATVSSIGVGDLDDDGALDVLAGLASGEVIAWRNPLTGTQPFATAWGSSVTLGNLGLPMVGLAVTDADHDGRLDVVATGSGSPSMMTVWHNPGQPFSGGWSQVPVGNSPDAILALTAADFHRDGDDDFVTATGDADIGGLQFWTNALIRSSVRFQTPNLPSPDNNHTADITSGGGFGKHALEIHDMNRDGRPDIVAATMGGSLLILENNGSPFVSDWPSATVGTSHGFFSVAVGDLDGDGWPDIATSTTLSTTGVATTALVHVWRNEGAPFSGSWISQTVVTLPRQVMGLALGDVGREGHLQIVASTGITTSLYDLFEHDVPTSDDNAIWLLRPPPGGPFASTWISSTVCTTTYSANSVALGDLDNDGWLDVVFGTDHAPLGTTNWPDTSGFYDGPEYQVRACRSLGNPYSPAGWQVYDVGRDETPVTFEVTHHSFWGTHVHSVAVGDLDDDGDLDVVAGSASGDSQLTAYRNSGTPFDGNIWESTWIGYGSITNESAMACENYPEECPWLESPIYSIEVGDLNGDGWLDLVTGFDSQTNLPYWINTGLPFGEAMTDTHWIRTDLDITVMCPVYSLGTADLDGDGRLDVAAADRCTSGEGRVRVWRNLGGIARHTFKTNYSLATIEDGASESRLSFAIGHNGRPYDHGLVLDYLKIGLVDSCSRVIDEATANALFRSWQICRDANGDGVWQPSDTPVITLTGFSPVNGHLTLTFPSGDPSVAISAGQTVTYFVVLNMQPAASHVFPDPGAPCAGFRLYYTPYKEFLIRDRVTQASVSVEESRPASTRSGGIVPVPAPSASVAMTAHPSTIWADGASTSTITASVTTVYGYPVLDGTVVTFTTSAGSLPASPYTTTTTDGAATAVLTSSTDLTTATVTGTASVTATGTVAVDFVVGPRASLRINDALGPGGSEVTTHTLSADDALTVHVAGYDPLERFMDNPTDVTWGGTGIVSGNLSPTVGVRSTTFAPVLAGTGTITVADGSGHVDATDTITVTPGALHHFAFAPLSDQTAGQSFSVTITAQDEHGNTVVGYAGSAALTDTTGTISPTTTGNFVGGAWTGEVTITQAQSGVSITAQGGGASGTSNSFDVGHASLHHFAFAPVSDQTAGQSFSVTITAQDEYDNTVSGYTGSAALTDTTGTISPTTTGSFVGGVWTGEVTITQAQSEVSITAQDGGASGTSNSFDVSPGALHHFAFAPISDQTAGQSFSVTITAQDECGNTVGGYTGSAALTDTTGTISPTTTGNFVGGAWTGEVTITQAQSGVSITAQDGGASGTSNSFDVGPGALHHFAFAPISDQMAGQSFSVTIMAQDEHGNTVGGYAGSATLTDTTGTISPTTTGNFVGGAWTGEVAITRAGSGVVITAQDGDVSGTSDSFDVGHASLHHFTFAPISDQTAGQSFNVTIAAQDEYGNTVVGYAGSAVLTDTTGTISPTTTGSFVGGVWTGEVTITQAQSEVSITAQDGGASGTSNSFDVGPGALHHFAFAPVSDQTAGQSFSVTITAQDECGNTVAGYTGSAALTDTTGTISPTTTGNFVSGVWTGEVAITRAQVGVSITAQDGGASGASGTSDSFDVGHASLHHFAFAPISEQRAGWSFSVTITAQDEHGNTVITYTGSVMLTDTTGTISPTTTGNFAGGVWMGEVAITRAQSGVTITAQDGDVSGTSNSFDVKPDHFAFDVIPSPQTAGESFQVTITAQGKNDNTLTGYIGPAELSDTTGTISPTTTGGFVDGVWTGEVAITQAGSGVVITAQDGSASGSSNSFDVDPAAISRIELEPAEAFIDAGQSVTYTVEGFDACGNFVQYLTDVAEFAIEAGAGGFWEGNVYHSELEGTWTVTATVVMWSDHAILHVASHKTYLPLLLR